MYIHEGAVQSRQPRDLHNEQIVSVVLSRNVIQELVLMYQPTCYRADYRCDASLRR